MHAAMEAEIVCDRVQSSRRDFLRCLGFVAASCSVGIGRSAFGAAEPLRKITYAVATADLNVGYPFATLAKALGYYQAGRDSTLKSCPASPPRQLAQLLLSGRADMGLAQPDPVVIQRVKIKIPLVSFLRCLPARHQPLRRQPGFANPIGARPERQEGWSE